jgi:hypothetical protein
VPSLDEKRPFAGTMPPTPPPGGDRWGVGANVTRVLVTQGIVAWIRGDQKTVPTSLLMMVPMLRSARAAMVIDGLQAPVEPGISEPSMT